MSEAIVHTTLTLHYISRAEAELDIGGLCQSSSVINQRQPVPAQWGLKVHVTECRLEQQGAITVVTADAAITGPNKEKAEKWIREFAKMNGLRREGHQSQNEELLKAREQARQQKANYEAEKANN